MAEQFVSSSEEGASVSAKQAELKREKAMNVPLDLGMIGVRVKKAGIYTITLGFDPGGTPLHEFREQLKRDLSGTIEVFSNTQHYTTIRYEDFVDFAEAPQGGGYGPVYKFNFNFSTSEGILRFYPKIKANRHYTCLFAVTRQIDSSGDRKIKSHPISNIHSLSRNIDKNNNSKIPIKIDRIDVFLEVPSGRYCMSIGFLPHEERELLDIADFRLTLYSNYRGTIEILKEGKQYKYIRYSDSINISVFESFTGYEYSFNDMHPGWYTFKPKIFSIQNRTFGFEIEPRYLGK